MDDLAFNLSPEPALLCGGLLDSAGIVAASPLSKRYAVPLRAPASPDQRSLNNAGRNQVMAVSPGPGATSSLYFDVAKT